jgi:hypothetical protein
LFSYPKVTLLDLSKAQSANSSSSCGAVALLHRDGTAFVSKLLLDMLFEALDVRLTTRDVFLMDDLVHDGRSLSTNFLLRRQEFC